MRHAFVELYSFGALEDALGSRPDAARRAAEYVRQHARTPGKSASQAGHADLPACPARFGVAGAQE